MGESFVPSTGPEDASFLIIGQGPSREEAEIGKPFAGRAGQRLTRWLIASGIDKSHARITNVVWCRLPDDRFPTNEEVEFCRRAHWGRELEHPRRVVAAVGVPAMTALGVGRGMNDTGRWSAFDQPPSPTGAPGWSGWGVGLVHPSAIIKGNWGLDPFQITHLRRAQKVLAGADPEIPDFTQPAPNTTLWPTFAELEAWGRGIGPDGITVDVEAAGNVLRTVGLRRNDDLVGVEVGFRGDNGEVWIYCPECRGLGGCIGGHPRDDFGAVVEWLARLLADVAIPKCFHNGIAYDIPEQLENVGFVVRGELHDTMLAAHIRLPEMRKGLEPLSAALLGASGWKALSDAEMDEDNVK